MNLKFDIILRINNIIPEKKYKLFLQNSTLQTQPFGNLSVFKHFPEIASQRQIVLSDPK